jgi:hypothetical protein
MKVLNKEVDDKLVYAGAAVVGLPLAIKVIRVLSKPTVKEGKYKGVAVPDGAFDVLVVGGGPSGSTLAYFYAKARTTRLSRGLGRGRAAPPAVNRQSSSVWPAATPFLDATRRSAGAGSQLAAAHPARAGWW